MFEWSNMALQTIGKGKLLKVVKLGRVQLHKPFLPPESMELSIKPCFEKY